MATIVDIRIDGTGLVVVSSRSLAHLLGLSCVPLAGPGLPVRGSAAQMATHVTEEIGTDAPLDEAPLPVALLEAV